MDQDAFWDYFQHRGGVRTFGYPVSRTFTLLGCTVQVFQRGVVQMQPSGSVTVMNLLDQGLMPYTRINSSTFPAPDQELAQSAPSVYSANYADMALNFVRDNAPDYWNGLPVGFEQTFLNTVTYGDAFPNGGGEAGLLALMDLEMLGLPTSRPVPDPNNGDFVYQRFQRGILHYDRGTGQTQGLLLGDYFKAVLTGQGIPSDLDAEASGSPFYRQYNPGSPGSLARPDELPGSNLDGAFDPE